MLDAVLDGGGVVEVTSAGLVATELVVAVSEAFVVVSDEVAGEVALVVSRLVSDASSVPGTVVALPLVVRLPRLDAEDPVVLEPVVDVAVEVVVDVVAEVLVGEPLVGDGHGVPALAEAERDSAAAAGDVVGVGVGETAGDFAVGDGETAGDVSVGDGDDVGDGELVPGTVAHGCGTGLTVRVGSEVVVGLVVGLVVGALVGAAVGVVVGAAVGAVGGFVGAVVPTGGYHGSRLTGGCSQPKG